MRHVLILVLVCHTRCHPLAICLSICPLLAPSCCLVFPYVVCYCYVSVCLYLLLVPIPTWVFLHGDVLFQFWTWVPPPPCALGSFPERGATPATHSHPLPSPTSALHLQKKKGGMEADDFRACLISMGYALVGTHTYLSTNDHVTPKFVEDILNAF